MLNNKIWISVVLIIVVFSGLILYGDFNEVLVHISTFPIKYIMAALALTSLNYFLRFLRWEYYLKILQINIPAAESGLIFLSGLGMSLTPWKMGEVLKSYFLQRRHEIPVLITAPVVFMERVTDVLAVICLGFIGIKWLPQPVQIILYAAAFFLTASWYFAIKYGDRIINLPVIRRWKHLLETAQQTSHKLNSPKTVLVATTISLLAWASEGTALWIILSGLEAQVNLSSGITIYSVSTLVGALTTIPGGLIGTEGTMVTLIQELGNGKGTAATSTLLVRIVTLWFALLIGMITILYLSRNNKPKVSRKKINQNSDPEV